MFNHEVVHKLEDIKRDIGFVHVVETGENP